MGVHIYDDKLVTFHFQFNLSKNICKNIEHEVYHFMRHNGLLAEQRTKNEIDQLLFECS